MLSDSEKKSNTKSGSKKGGRKTPLTLTGGSRLPFEGKVRQHHEACRNEIPAMVVTDLSDKKTHSAIDWIAITIHAGWEGSIYPDVLPSRWIETAPARGYNVGREFTDGRRESMHTSRPDMGIHIVYSGSTINKISTECDLSGFELLRWYVDKKAKITRLDVAVDAYNHNLKVDEVHEMALAGGALTRVKSFRLMTANDGGATFYAGSPSSEAMLRVYDKGVESGAGGDWTRAELQLRDSKAFSVATMLCEAKKEHAGKIIQSVIRGHFDMPEFQTWKDVMNNSNPLPVARSNDKDSDTRKWLMEVAAPCLAKLAWEGEAELVINQFMDAFDAALEKLQDDDIVDSVINQFIDNHA